MQNTYIDYAQQTCDAIEILVNNALNKAKFDRTIQATVVNCVDEDKGLYKIKQQDAVYTATAINKYVVYKPQALVYVLIPEGDYSKEKKILSAVGTNKDDLSEIIKKIDEIDNRLAKIEKELF